MRIRRLSGYTKPNHNYALYFRTWHSGRLVTEKAHKPGPIDPRDMKAIMAGLDRWASDGDFVALRTRAFACVLADGALRTKSAVWLDADEVVKDSSAGKISILQKVVQRPCEGNNYRGRSFLLSDRSRNAIADYLRVARDDGWLQNPERLAGPLWIAWQYRGTQQRLSQRTVTQAWNAFLAEHVKLSRDYQLDDLVLTGRLNFLAAARLNTEVLSEHTGLSERSADSYRTHLLSSPSSTARNVMSRLNRKQKEK